VIKISPKENKKEKIKAKEEEKVKTKEEEKEKIKVKDEIKEVVKEVEKEIEVKEKDVKEVKEIIIKEKDKEKEKSLSISSKDDEISPAATPSSKKEKPKKKPPETKKKKEETTEKKEIVAAKPQVASGPSIAENVPIEIDDRLKVYYRGSSDYEAKVLDIQHQDGKTLYKVHYKGWNARYDEWIQRESIAENLTKDEVGKKKQSSNNNAKDNNNPKTPSTSSTNLQTPTSKNASKRARNRADTTTSSRSTTPLSNTSSKTKVAQKRPIRGTPTSKSSTKGSIIDDNSSESDEPIKKPADNKKDKDDDKNSSIQKSSSDSAVMESASKDAKGKDNKQHEKVPETSKSDDEKSTKSSIKSGKSPFEAKGKLKTIQRDSSRSSFHSTDSDSSHSVPSDVPNSSKSAYTSENESNDPEKIPLSTTAIAQKIDTKKSFRFDEDANEAKPATSFFEKVTENKPVESKPTEISTIFPTKKPNIFQEKKLAQRAAQNTPESAPPPPTTTTPGKIGRFSQLEKTLTKDIGIKAKAKEVKVEDKLSADSDIYEFKDTEEIVPKSSVVKKQESPNEGTTTKKQQLAQQRKQARQNLQQQKEALAETIPHAMEDIESMIKTSIVSFPQSKKAKKSPMKEEKPTQSMIVARTTSAQPTTSQNVIVQSAWSSLTNPQEIFSKVSVVQNPHPIQAQPPIQVQVPPSRQPVIKSESTFDVLRKSPCFNMHLMDDLPSPPKIIPYPISSPTAIIPSTSVITTTPITSRSSILQGPLKFSSEVDSRDLLKPIMLPSKEDEKPEIGVLMKILDQPYEIPPKAEKSASIADKLLKAINQKETSEKEAPQVDVIKKEEPQPVVKIEERKSDPYLYKAKSPGSNVGKQYPISTTSSSSTTSLMTASKKPLLISTDSKVDEKVPVKGNIELQGIIEKLESAISTPAINLLETASSLQLSIVKKSNDDSDTDSDRLVIEDETAPTELTEKKKSQMGVLESIMMQDEIPYKTLSTQNVKESEKKVDSSSSQEQQPSETMSLLLCEETIPGSPAPKDPLSEIGRSPTSSSSGGFVHPPSMPQSGYIIKYSGSMTTALLHQQYQATAANTNQTNLKQIPMDIDTDSIEAATGDILRDKLKSERGSATSSGNNTNNNSDNSNDDQSESEKNSKLATSSGHDTF